MSAAVCKPRVGVVAMILTLVVGVVTAAWFGMRGAPVNLRLVYLTNTSERTAVFLLTNAGFGPVNINGGITLFSTNGPGSSCMTPTPDIPIGAFATKVLAPGQFVRLEAKDILSSYRWKARMTYQPHGLRERIAASVWTSTSTFMQNYGRRLFAPPRNITVYSDCVTNLDMERLRLAGVGDVAFWQRNGIPGIPPSIRAPAPIVVTNSPAPVMVK